MRRIALLIDTATSWGAGLIEGIAAYTKGQRLDWLFSIEPRGKYDPMMLPEGWRGAGVIARVTHSDLAQQLIDQRIPAVNVSWFSYGENLIPRCTCDEHKAGELAAEYFLSNGYRQFAYCGSTIRPTYNDRLGAAFSDAVKKQGFLCETFLPDRDHFSSLDSEDQLKELSHWLKGLPRATALLAFDSIQGRQLTEACAQAGLTVPDDIAVLGGEHDELCSRISSPPLSGIDQSPGEVGFRAAEMLEQLMTGQRLETTDLRLPPRRIITRHSTDKIAIDDELLAEALRYIREHFAEQLHIRDILEAVPLGRRALEIGLRTYLGRTPREEIRRIRVEKAVQMLCDTDMPITKIAIACGFDRPELLTRAFRLELEATPTQFRKRLIEQRAKAAAV